MCDHHLFHCQRCWKCVSGFDYMCLINRNVRHYLKTLELGLGGLPEMVTVKITIQIKYFFFSFTTYVPSYAARYSVGDAFVREYHDNYIDLPVLSHHLQNQLTIDVTISFN